LHAVAGTWLVLFYLVAALTGLWWSYDFYRNAVNRMAGVSTPLRRPAPPPGDSNAPTLPLDRAWSRFRDAVPDATRTSIALSTSADAPIEIRYLTATSPHDRAFGTMKIDVANGEIIAREPYSELPAGRRFIASMFPLHSGSFFGTPGRIAVALAALLLPFFAVTGIWLWILRRRSEAVRVVRVREPIPASAIAQRKFVESSAPDLRAQ
jgi:sulfite reductase (NADPH) flavoprotein alpha-component